MPPEIASACSQKEEGFAVDSTRSGTRYMPGVVRLRAAKKQRE